MALVHAFATYNNCTGLAAGSFTWSGGITTNRSYLNDGRMDNVFSGTSAASSQTVVIDFGAAVSLSAFATLNSNLGSLAGAAMRIRGATDSGITAGVVTVYTSSAIAAPILAPRLKDHVFGFAATSKRYWELQFSYTGTQTITIGEIYAATVETLTRAGVYGQRGDEEAYKTSQVEMDAGEIRSHFLSGPHRKKRIEFADLSTTERDAVMAMWRKTYGGALPILWIENYSTTATDADSQDCIFGKVQQDVLSWSEFDYLRHNIDALEVRSYAREVGA